MHLPTVLAAAIDCVTAAPSPLARSLVDDGVELLSTLRSLAQLNLQECWQVTDRGLEHLSGARLSMCLRAP